MKCVVYFARKEDLGDHILESRVEIHTFGGLYIPEFQEQK